MAGKSKNRNPHRRQFLVDLVHIIIGAAAVLLAVFILFDIEARLRFCPVIFFLAALLNLINAIPRLGGSFKRNPYLKTGLALLVLCLILLVLTGVSAYVLWR